LALALLWPYIQERCGLGLATYGLGLATSGLDLASSGLGLGIGLVAEAMALALYKSKATRLIFYLCKTQ
jgi:hypothetical protein